MKKRICAILILMMLLLNSSVMILISEAVEAVNDAVNATNEGGSTVSNVDLKLNADYLVNNVENNVQLTATLKTDDTGYSLFKNPSISIEMPAEITDVVIETPFLMYNNQVFTITNSEVITNESGNKVINVKLEGQQTEYETDSILEGTNIVIPAKIIVSKQIDTMVSNIKLRYTNEIEGQTIYEANGEDCETDEITLINKIIRNLPAIENDEDAKTIEFEQQGIKVEIIEMLGNCVLPDNGTLYEQQIVKHVVRFTNNSVTAQPVNFTANIPNELTYIEFFPQEIVHNEEYDAYYIPRHAYYKLEKSNKQINFNIEELGIGETKELYFEFLVNDLEEVKEKVISINYELKTSNGQTGKYNILNTINEAEITTEMDCYRLNDRNDWQYGITIKNITDRKLTNIKVFCEIDNNFTINEIYRVITSGEHEQYDLNNVTYNMFTYSIDSLEPGQQCYIAVDGITKDKYEDEDTNSYEMKGVYKVYGDDINTYISNEITVIAGIEKVKVSMTSDKEGQELKTDDEITYTVNIENIGNEKLAMSKYSRIRVFDFIPEELEPISATYTNYIMETEYISEIGDYVGAPLKVEKCTSIEQKDLDLTYRMIPEGATAEETPNIDLNLSIPYGETITITIKAKVKMAAKTANITNIATVEGYGMVAKTASLTHTLLPYDYDETQQPEMPEEPGNPELDNIGGGTIEDSETPEEPTQPEEPFEVNVTGVELIPSETKLKVGQSTNLIATVLPDNATNKAVTWSSSDESIAKIVNGTVMALKEGTATITVTTEDGNKTATSTIIVENNNEETTGIPVTGIQVTPSGATILVGNTVKLRAAVIPSNATNKKVTWSSSNTDVATVDDDGLVTGVKEGTTTITVTTEEGNKTATCNITVQNINEEDPTKPENPEQPTNPDDPNQPTNPENPENPNKPSEPENPTKPENPEQSKEEKLTISGTAWIDTNENGKRDKEEQKYSNMTVMLYNYGTKKLVSSNGIAIEKKTDENGKYEFTDLEKGKYIVIFWYDTNKYELTGYQKVGISSSENSDAISKNVTLIGEKKVAGLTDIMNLEQNTENIDIGLVENKNFDFSIQKYINKITVQTNKGTKTYTYNNKNFAKVEIHSKEIEGAQVIIEYKMVVKNEGELPGKVDLIVDEIPSNLNFHSELNNSWYKTKDGICTTALSGEAIGIGESREITIVLTKNVSGNNVGTIANTAKIGSTSNDKGIEEKKLENNNAKAEVLITVSTGIMKWIGLIILTIIVLGVMVFIVLKDKKIIKTITFMFMVGICMFGNTLSVYGYEFTDDGEWSTTGIQWAVTVGNGVKNLRCVTPNLTMCNAAGAAHHIATEIDRKFVYGTEHDKEIIGQTEDDVKFSLTNSTKKDNVKITKTAEKIKIGPFKVTCSKGGSSFNAKIGECKVTYLQYGQATPKTEEFTTAKLNEEFYIELPKDTIKVFSINVKAYSEYKYNNKYYGRWRVYYSVVATGSSSIHGAPCIQATAEGRMQTLGEDYEGYRIGQDHTGKCEEECTITGPWLAPGNLKIEKLVKDTEGATKTYIPNVGVKVTKGTNIAASQYLTLEHSNGTKEPKISVGETITILGFETVSIGGKTYNVKWNGSRANGTELVLTKGYVTIKDVESGIQYTAVENSNPNYGYEQVINKDTKGSSSTVNSAHYTSTISIYNKKSTGALVIKKVDKDDSSVILPNVQFVIKAKKNSTEQGYIKIIADESTNVTKFTNSNYAQYVKSYGRVKDMTLSANAPISYVSNPGDATKFVTGSDGKVTINNIEGTMLGTNNAPSTVGTQYYYKAEEYWNPNYGYSKENYYGYGLTGYKADTADSWKVNTETGWKLVPSAWPSDTRNANKSYSTSYQVTLTNQKLTGNIRINKFDAEGGNNVKLQHIGFVLKAELLGESSNNFNITGKYIKVKIDKGTQSKDSNGYAKYTRGNVRIADGKFDGKASDVMTFVDNPKDATVFYTDENGKILIANLLSGTNGENYINYTIEEYDSKTYGYVAEIGEGYTNATLDKTHVVTPTVLSFTKTKTNTPNDVDKVNIGNYKQTGNLTIYKRDNEQPTKLEQATFVLKAKLKQNGVLVEKYVKAIIDIDNTIKGNSVTIDSNGYAKELVGMGRIRDITNSLGTTNEPTSIKFVDDIKDATKFTTNYNGSISIANLLMSTNGVDYISYYLQEVENDNYGYSGVSNEYTVEYETKDGWFAVNRKTYQETTGIYAENYTSTSQETITPYIPEGFRHLEGDLNSGYVIMDGDGNQYVWIEVPKTLEIYKTAGLDIKEFTESEYISIENDLHRYTKAYREGSYSVDEYGEDLEGNSPTGLTSSEYYEQKKTMLKSIYKYGGFYVGRYETGVKSGYRTSARETIQEPAIRPDAYPYNFVSCSQAQNLASSFASNGYTSSLMYGVQWDLILKYLETKGIATGNLTENSTSYGNYRDSRYTIVNKMAKYSNNYGTSWQDGAYGIKNVYDTVLLSTGANSQFMMKNIYDLAGNLEEWTLEQYKVVSESSYTLRGGSFAGGKEAVVYRNPSQDMGLYSTGFRVVLYKNDEVIEQVEETKPYIPQGTSHVAGTDLDTGYVIQDADGNQYVWVEVPRNKTVYQTAGLKITSFTDEEYAKIENDLHKYTDTYRNGTTYVDEYPDDLVESETGLTSTQYSDLKKTMLKSIYKYGGFYVGRYETGIADTYRTSNTATLQTPVIQQNAYPYNMVTVSQAQKLSESFARDGYTTSLMFGVQWDLIMRYLESKGVSQAELNENSSSWGNYHDSEFRITNTNAKYSFDSVTWVTAPYNKITPCSVWLTTGATEAFSKQNISDISGNDYEITLEYTSNPNGPGALRGSVIESDPEKSLPIASGRRKLGNEESSRSVTFRTVLYKNDEVVEKTKPYIPEGTSHVAGTSLDTGYVIQDAKGNQYVWVEVPRNKTVYQTAGLKITSFTDEEYAKIENDLHTYTNTYRNGTTYLDEYGEDAQGNSATGLTKEQYYEQKKKMLKSIYKNGGFYVGRYETGIDYSEGLHSGNATQTPVIKPNKYPYFKLTASQAQSLSSSFASKGYTSSLMFGVQWDLILKYLESKNAVTQNELISNSMSWGNYYRSAYSITNTSAKYSSGGPMFIENWHNAPYQTSNAPRVMLSTGASDTFSRQNISDLAGNAYEYTLEIIPGNGYAVTRGGHFYDTAGIAANDRHYEDSNYGGFRVSLYRDEGTGSDETMKTRFSSITVKNKKQTMNLQLNKVDIDSAKVLERATFVVKANLDGEFSNKYIRIIPDNNSNTYALEVTGSIRIADKLYTSRNNTPCVDFVDNIEDATHFVTDENGEIAIQNLIMSTDGINRIQYMFEEVENDHYGYVADGSNAAVRFDSQTRNDPSTETKYSFDRQSSLQTKERSGVVTYGEHILVKNIKQTGNLYINKGDYEQFDDVKLEKVTFLVKAHLEGNSDIDGKYIRIMPDKADSYANQIEDVVRIQDKIYDKETEQNQSPLLFVNKNNATKFVTNDEGKIIIMNLLMSTNGKDHIQYSFEEIENDNYGYVADGTNTTLRHKGQSVDTIEDCKYTIPIQPSKETASNAHRVEIEKYPINLRNVKQTGNLQINKIDFDDYSALTEEVTFAIKAHLNGNGFIDEKYIKIIADPNVYQQNVTNKNDGYVDIAKDVVRIKDQCYNYDNIKESVVFVNNYDEATKFVTGSDGNLTIMNLIMSTNGKNRITYTFEELKNDNYGYVAEKGQYNNYTLRYPSQEINVREEVPQTIERQSSIETLNKANVVQEFFIKNIKQTGNIVITKSDITSGEKLANVEFVLKAFNDQNITHESNEYYGIDGKYVKATIEKVSEGEVRITDITYVSDINEATKFKTNAEGKLTIYNLLMSTNGADLIRYHLVETKNPNYGYLADTEYFEDFRVTFEPQNGSEMLGDYLIVDRQIKQETDGKTSENDTVLTIKNEQIYTRLSGMVWEDIAGGKANAIDNQYIDAVYNNAENSLEGDALIEGIVVYLYKDGKLVTTTTTDENGYYMFGTYHENGIYENADYWNKNNGKDVVIPGRNGDTLTSTAENENGNIVIKDLSKYHIEFEYDGLRFTTVKPFETENNATEVINSNGIEVESNHKDKKDRIQRDKDFEIIKNDEGRKFNEDGTPKDVIEGWAPGYNLEYNSDKPQNHQAQYIDHWTYSANGNISEDGANNPYGANTSGKKYFKLAKNEVEDYAVVSAVKNIAWKDEYVIGDIIPYINQGLYRRELPDLAIATDIKETEIIVDGYKNTYTYEKRALLGDIGEKSDGFGIEVKYGNTAETSYSSRGLNTYTRPLYASDLVYNLTSDDELMKVYITYQIVVKNQADTLRARVNEIINYYDSRYEIVNVTGATYDPNKVYKDVSIAKNVGENVEGEVKYNKVILTLDSDTEIIEHGEKQEIITIKFKLNPDALRAIAYEKATLYNVSEITSFTSYYGDDTYCAEHQKASEKGRSNSENPMLYAGIDTDSAPNSAVIRAERRAETKQIDVNRDENRQNYLVEKVTLTDESLATFEDDTDQAPSLILGIDEEDPIRGLTGIVFEDNGIFTDEEGNKISEDHTNKTVHTAQHRLGNGIYDEGENIIKDAKIELYRVDNNGNPEEKRTQLYKLKIDAVNKKAEIVTEAFNAITWSEDTISRWSEDPENPLYDKTYNYKFMGVLPGKYLIRYSYGNFEQDNPDEDKFVQKDKITQIVDSTGALDIVDVLDYKSTIITSDTITTALDLFGTPYDRIGDLDWILGEKQADDSRQNIVRYSDAVDDLDKRKEIDGDNREVYFDRESKRKVISADTAAFEVGVEYKEVNEYKETQTMYDDEFEFSLKDGKVVRLPQFSIISPYQDFGIIERARADIYIDKTISNLRIVLSTGQELINGDPYKEKLPYIKALQMNDDIRKDRSKLIYAEIDNELVQGATLYLKYDITVHNDSEIDYLYNDVAGKEFYYYGKIKDVTRVDQGIFKVVDYMDSKLVFDEQLSKDGSWKKVKLEELTGEKSDYDNGKRFISEDVEQCLEKNSYTMLVTSAFENVEAGTSKTINAYASKLLAVGKEEFAFENHVEILHTKGLRETKDTDPGNYIPEDPYPDPVIPDGPGNEQDDDWIKVIITPPTGLPLSKIKE